MESSAASSGDWKDKQFSVLLPLVDLLNHRPLSKVEWQAGKDTVGLAVLEDIGPGQDVDNNYGPKNNEQCETSLTPISIPFTSHLRYALVF